MEEQNPEREDSGFLLVCWLFLAGSWEVRTASGRERLFLERGVWESSMEVIVEAVCGSGRGGAGVALLFAIISDVGLHLR